MDEREKLKTLLGDLDFCVDLCFPSFNPKMSSPLSSSQARSSLSYIPYSLILNSPGELEDLKIKYVHHLVAYGDLGDLRAHLDALPEDEARYLVNTGLYDTWFGNTLHAAAYWNTGESALAIFAYLMSKGATFMLDYYGDSPWTISGCSYISPISGVVLGNRDVEEFVETHAALRTQYSGEGAGAGAPQAFS